MLYMFQAVPPPIIRSSKTVNTASGIFQTFTAACRYRERVGTIAAGNSKGLTSTLCCTYSFWAPDDGRRNRLKHVEHFTEINKLCSVASCWLCLEIYLGLCFWWNLSSCVVLCLVRVICNSFITTDGVEKFKIRFQFFSSYFYCCKKAFYVMLGKPLDSTAKCNWNPTLLQFTILRWIKISKYVGHFKRSAHCMFSL
jgi:hypothetical protein